MAISGYGKSITGKINSDTIANLSNVTGATVTDALNNLSSTITSVSDTWDRVGTVLTPQTAGDTVSLGTGKIADVNASAGVFLGAPGEKTLNTSAQSLIGAINEIEGRVSAENTWDRNGTTLHPRTIGDSVAIGLSAGTTGYNLSVSGKTRVGNQTVAGDGNAAQSEVFTNTTLTYTQGAYNFQANAAVGSQTRQYRGAGTMAAPTQAVSGAFIGGFQAIPYNGGGWNTGGAGLIAVATENTSANAGGMELRAYTVENQTDSPSEKLRIAQDGCIGINTTAQTQAGYRLHVRVSGAHGGTLSGGQVAFESGNVQTIQFATPDASNTTFQWLDASNGLRAQMAVINTDREFRYFTSDGGQILNMNMASGIRFNDGGADIDFLVEGDNSDNLIRTDASEDRVAIGTSAPKARFHIQGSAGGVSGNPAANSLLMIEHAGNAGIQIYTGSANTQFINFGDPDAAAAGAILYTQNNDTMILKAGNRNMIAISSAAMNHNSSNQDADVTFLDTGGNASIFIDASASGGLTGGAVGIQKIGPHSTFQVSGSFATLIREVQATATIAANDQIIKCSSSVGFTVWLPTAVGIAGRQYTVKNAMAALNVRIEGDAAETIDSTTIAVVSGMNARTVVSDGTGWWIV